MSKMPAKFLSCDWGTSSFRLRLVSTTTDEVLAKSTDTSGVKELYERATERGVRRASLFAEVATKHISEIGLRHSLNGQPLVISGMASSAIGWKELPYAKVPFALDGSGLRIEELNWDCPEGLGPTYIVSGAATDCDIMRGEECQAIGIMADSAMLQFREGATLILPGTHSKHIDIEFGRIKDFKTYITGELFETLSHHTVLRATVDPKASVRAHAAEFHAGMKTVKENGLAASLFKVRARGVLSKVNPAANAAFLSGILIGSEVGHIADMNLDPDWPIIVAGSEELKALYALALPRRKGIIFTDIGRATITAHKLILGQLCR